MHYNSTNAIIRKQMSEADLGFLYLGVPCVQECACNTHNCKEDTKFSSLVPSTLFVSGSLIEPEAL